MERKTKIVSREALMKALWDQEYFVDDNTLTVNINRLRKKLHEIQLDDFIVTKRVWVMLSNRRIKMHFFEVFDAEPTHHCSLFFCTVFFYRFMDTLS